MSVRDPNKWSWCDPRTWEQAIVKSFLKPISSELNAVATRKSDSSKVHKAAAVFYDRKSAGGRVSQAERELLLLLKLPRNVSSYWQNGICHLHRFLNREITPRPRQIRVKVEAVCSLHVLRRVVYFRSNLPALPAFVRRHDMRIFHRFLQSPHTVGRGFYGNFSKSRETSSANFYCCNISSESKTRSKSLFRTAKLSFNIKT